MKKFISLIIAVIMFMTIAAPAVMGQEVPEREVVNLSRQLMTKGNKIVYADDPQTEVQLVGLNVDSLEFSSGWQMHKTMMEALDNWHSNIIRLPITHSSWGDEKYRKTVDDMINMASARGKYIIIDLHKYEYIKQDNLDFWVEFANLYKNNPTVLFGLLNEPHTISWEEWRNGGKKLQKDGSYTKMIGHQQLVEAIRDTGAKNILLAGGLDWGYDLRGIVGEAEGDDKVYALIDQGSNDNTGRAGYGIIYDTHIYPWKGRTANWDQMIGTARKMYPLLSGENGWDNGTIKAIEGAEYPETSEKWYTIWNPEFYEFVNDVDTYGAYLNWTGWCFHPGSSPRIISESTKRHNYDYSYLPTEYWGTYVKEEMNTVMGENLLANKTIVEASNMDTAKLAIDNDYDTMWVDKSQGEKYITVDMGGVYNVDKWAIRHAGAQEYREVEQLENTVDFDIYTSIDGVNWTYLDGMHGNTAPVSERSTAITPAKYVKVVFGKTNYYNDGVLKIKDIFVSGNEYEEIGEQEFYSEVPERELVNFSRQLITKGNKVVYADDPETQVRLVGLNVDSLEYSTGWQMHRTMMEALDNWHSNIIRLPVSHAYWGDEKYQKTVDELINMASARGKYVVVDLHKYESFLQEYVDFWKTFAPKYANNPTVLYGILNEAHTISWDEWRHGGEKIDKNGKKVNFYGHQDVVELIRDLGAKNIIVAGGLDWGYDLRGIVGEAEGDDTIYALVDQGSNDDTAKTGYGIIYDSHIYPWKGRTADWDKMMGTARKQYPILSGENGWDNETIKVIEGASYPEDSEKWYTIWAPEYFDFVNDEETYGAYLNWTGWCFHPWSSPRIIDERFKDKNYDYSYLPTDYWGVYVQEEMNKQYGENLLTKAQIVSAGNTKYAALATDNMDDTIWVDSSTGSKYIEYKLDGEYMIDTWAIRHSGATNEREVEQLKNTVDFTVKTSVDGKNWTVIEDVKGNIAPVTERYIKPVAASYVRFEFNKLNYEDTNELRIRELFVTGDKPGVVINQKMTVAREGGKAKLSIPVMVESTDKQTVTCMVAMFNDDMGMVKSKDMVVKTYKLSGDNTIDLIYDLPQQGQYVRVIVFNSADDITAYKFK
ncbi:MAG: cellulase family glycosylhydrolase [Eubacteriales bacterium]|nr:cellulase family glycosylhydrolase [Eubacteriales bacterium]